MGQPGLDPGARTHAPAARNPLSLASAVAATVLSVAIAVVVADAPAAGASGDVVLAWASAHRTTLLACTPAWTLSVAAVFAFYVSVAGDLADHCVTRSERALVQLGAAAGRLTFAISLVGFLFLTTLAWMAPDLAPGDARLLSSLSALAVNVTGIPTALTLLPWAWVMHRRGLAPPALGVYAAGVSALHLVSTAAFAQSGPLSPSGVGAYLAPPLFYGWVLWIASVKLCRA